MRITTSALALMALVLVGCDLSEAERMDITRQKVQGVAPQVRGVAFFGRQEVSIDSLLGQAQGMTPAYVWTLLLGDRGTWESFDWAVRGWWRDSLIFSASVLGTYGSGYWDRSPLAGEWMRHPGELRTEIILSHSYSASDFHWQTDTLSQAGIPSLRFLQDFNELHWDTTFAKKSPRVGDTLRLKVGVDRGSPGRSDSMPVFADYTGLRTVGDYVRYLKPNDTATLSWVVTAPTGDSLHLNLGWGTLGESHSFGFRVAR